MVIYKNFSYDFLILIFYNFAVIVNKIWLWKYIVS